MGMVKIAIVDDEPVFQREMKSLLEKYMRKQGEACSFSVFSDANELLDAYDYSFDVIFLDIEMGSANGMEAAKHIRKTDKNVILIFATKLAQYAVEGYLVDALGYILKPFDYFNVELVMQKAMRTLALARKTQKLIVINDDGKEIIDSAFIQYIEVQDHMLIYHTEKGKYWDWSSLSQREKELKPYHFFRCHRCFLVNLDYISGIHSEQGDTVQVGDVRVPISRNKKAELMNELMRYYADKGGVIS